MTILKNHRIFGINSALCHLECILKSVVQAVRDEWCVQMILDDLWAAENEFKWAGWKCTTNCTFICTIIRTLISTFRHFTDLPDIWLIYHDVIASMTAYIEPGFEHSKAPVVFLLWVGYILFIRIRRPEVFDDWLNSIFRTEEDIDLVKVRALRTQSMTHHGHGHWHGHEHEFPSTDASVEPWQVNSKSWNYRSEISKTERAFKVTNYGAPIN